MIRLAGDLWLGDRPLARGLDLRIPPGAWTCLLGASGVGKSTLGRIVAGLPVAARFRGRADLPPPGGVAMLGQDAQLLPWASALENVVIGPRLRGEAPDRARARGLLARVGLAGLEDRRPAQLSGGQRQRVALARTLIEDRPVVILDEPFSALDAATKAAMQDLAADLLAGRTVILITHDPLEAARLGHGAWAIAPEATRPLALPGGPIPRPLDAPEVMAAQTTLFRELSQPWAA
ncbi:ABC transporter ATP-binding protein [Paracoccus aestuarii]|uniref:ABC transporter ATP-binding protein n=1 Tax=Paracoccus aestuarii TaxID=453842 RepID=A0A418ZR90_9RHOB|nr:ATP-binding cassette domain-containing protein [Paracoccus aestuarii]RJK98566.1 ABC transporter ATP-binding protein [Paracoccus aestuarii]WCR00386.1 ABC transporter ATP-binding protein [Paracoccus aestuarii]